MEPLSFEQIYDAHVQLVYWAAYNIAKDNDLASETVQTVFLRAYHHLNKLRSMEEPQLRSYLYRMAVNCTIDQLRRKKRTMPVENEVLDLIPVEESQLPETQYLDEEQKLLIRQSVDALPKPYREPIYLYYFAELSYHEICQMLQINEGTLKSRMARARAMLAKNLQRRCAL